MTSRAITQGILALSVGFRRLFRVNTGMGWVGTRVNSLFGVKVPPGWILLKDARPLHAGLVNGGGDVIGWESVVITQEMVGHKIARFVSIEVKHARDSMSEEQKAFMNAVNRSGGTAGEARSVEDAERILRRRIGEQ